MPIDVEKIGVIYPQLRFTMIEIFIRGGHEVAVMKVENIAVAHDCTSAELECECDFDVEVLETGDGRQSLVQLSDPHKCRAKRAVRRYIARRTSRRNGAHWRSIGLKEAILDIHERIRSGEYFGNALGGVIYAQEVSELLGVPVDEVLAACNELYKEERLQLNGMILADFVKRFRFPRQMRGIMAYIVEEPLGWPNGEAGDCYVCTVEDEFAALTGVERGVEAFGEADWPDIDMGILETYALEPVVTELRWIAQEADPVAKLKAIEREHIPAWLDGLAANRPGINRVAFAEFIFRLFELTLRRIEIDKAMRAERVTPAITIMEMADHLEQYYRK